MKKSIELIILILFIVSIAFALALGLQSSAIAATQIISVTGTNRGSWLLRISSSKERSWSQIRRQSKAKNKYVRLMQYQHVFRDGRDIAILDFPFHRSNGRHLYLKPERLKS